MLLTLFLSGCTQYYIDYNSQFLAPTNEPIEQKLPSIIFGIGENNIIREERYKNITYQSMLSTLISRELEENIAKDSRDKYGYLDVRLTYFSMAPNELTYLQNGTLFSLPTYIGYDDYLYIEFEFNFLDSKKLPIKKYIIDKKLKIRNYCSSPPTFLNDSLLVHFQNLEFRKGTSTEFRSAQSIDFSEIKKGPDGKKVRINNEEEGDCYDILSIYAVKEVIRELKDRIEKDYVYIANEMIDAGKIE